MTILSDDPKIMATLQEDFGWTECFFAYMRSPDGKNSQKKVVNLLTKYHNDGDREKLDRFTKILVDKHVNTNGTRSGNKRTGRTDAEAIDDGANAGERVNHAANAGEDDDDLDALLARLDPEEIVKLFEESHEEELQPSPPQHHSHAAPGLRSKRKSSSGSPTGVPTGGHKRPRGRGRKGMVWDAKIGDWVAKTE